MPINKLSQEIINQIAAGEVVERPASVIKELVENSIDAKADNIIIELEKSGTELIRITDNGIGMSKQDACLSLEPHATSKLSTIDDLYNIHSMGFRGEALASISSVSKFQLETCQTEQQSGSKISCVNNDLKIEDIGCPNGTKITVEQLFYNVPARKKFLKALSTEYNHILELISQIALINYQISFKLIHNSKTTLNLPKTDSWDIRIKQILGSEIFKNLKAINHLGSFNLTGFISDYSVARNNRKMQYIFVNKRPVQDFLVSKAINQAYQEILPKDSYPLFVIDLEIQPNLVDVNVHPRKTEIRFNNSNEIYREVYTLIKNELSNIDHKISLNLDSNKTMPKFSSGIIHASSKPKINNFALPQKNKDTKSAIDFARTLMPDAKQQIKSFDYSGDELGDWKLIGQIKKSYLVVESENSILIIDQHASAERILYEKYLTNWQAQEPKKQQLMFPETLELSVTETQILNDSLEILNKIGFDISDFGNNTFAINSIPPFINKENLKVLLTKLVGDLEEDNYIKLKSIEDKRDVILKYTACRSAVKFNDSLEYQEQVKLLKDIKNLPQDKRTCPHGRPFILELKFNELDKKFKR